MFPCFRVLIILYMNPWKSQVAQATLIHVCVENILYPKKCSLPDTLNALQRPALLRSARVGGLVLSAGRCSVPSVLACVSCLAWSALVLARPARLPALYSLFGFAGAGRGAPAGYTAAAQPRPVSPVTTEKIKKAQKTPPPTSKFQKIPRKKQKDPYKGSTFCAILSLQALKGRNLQWLKVK